MNVLYFHGLTSCFCINYGLVHIPAVLSPYVAYTRYIPSLENQDSWIKSMCEKQLANKHRDTNFILMALKFQGKEMHLCIADIEPTVSVWEQFYL